MNRIILTLIILMCISNNCMGSDGVDYTPADSMQVVSLLKRAQQVKPGGNAVVYFARQLCGIPYVAKTLEKNATERLVVNLQGLDCTTYVESVLALVVCAHEKSVKFEDYCRWLKQIRYAQGEVKYTRRLHYFTSWIDSNTALGIVKEITGQGKPFTGKQQLNIDFMSTHSELYPMMYGKPKVINEIKTVESMLTGRTVAYIPKQMISDTPLLRKTIKDGDILAITTSKKGLDTSHIGIAVWHSDGLHLLNASQIRHKVVEEPMTLGVYMAKHPTQTGIRVIRVVQ